jgi:hypothetical protein
LIINSSEFQYYVLDKLCSEVVKTCSNDCDELIQFVQQPRPARLGRKRPVLIVFGSFGGDRITAVFHRIVNERKRSDTPFSGRLRQLLACIMY